MTLGVLGPILGLILLLTNGSRVVQNGYQSTGQTLVTGTCQSPYQGSTGWSRDCTDLRSVDEQSAQAANPIQDSS